MAIPTEFTEFGLLPAGDYEAIIMDLSRSILVRGPSILPSGWDSVWRQQLLANLETLASQLWQCGIRTITVGGSFVEAKGRPGDIDGYFDCDEATVLSRRLELLLNRLDPHHAWAWHAAARRMGPESPRPQLPMWHQYRVELFPNYGQPCGILNPDGVEMGFPTAFRRSRVGFRPKGVIVLRKS